MTMPGLQGQGFPLGGVSEGRLDWSTGAESVRETLWHILLTRPGERVMRPAFGAGLTRFLHHPNNETTRQLIADVARRAIERWESRIDIVRIAVDSDPRALNRVVLTLDYRIRANGARENMDLGLELQG